MAAQIIVFLVGMFLFNILALSPLAGFSSTRRLFNKLPSENFYLNYITGAGLYSILQILLILAITVTADGLKGSQVFIALGTITIGLALLLFAIIGLICPLKKWWVPKKSEDELEGRIALLIGLISYIIASLIALFITTVILIGFFFPG